MPAPPVVAARTGNACDAPRAGRRIDARACAEIAPAFSGPTSVARRAGDPPGRVRGSTWDRRCAHAPSGPRRPSNNGHGGSAGRRPTSAAARRRCDWRGRTVARDVPGPRRCPTPSGTADPGEFTGSAALRRRSTRGAATPGAPCPNGMGAERGTRSRPRAHRDSRHDLMPRYHGQCPHQFNGVMAGGPRRSPKTEVTQGAAWREPDRGLAIARHGARATRASASGRAARRGRRRTNSRTSLSFASQ